MENIQFVLFFKPKLINYKCKETTIEMYKVIFRGFNPSLYLEMVY